jgi:hypothetical protein
MKILVKTSVNFHHRSACAMSIHFFSGEESESADRIALRSTAKGGGSRCEWVTAASVSCFWVSLLCGGRRYTRGARPELTDIVMQISIQVCANLFIKRVLLMADIFV